MFAISSADEFFAVYGYIYAYVYIIFFNIIARETNEKKPSDLHDSPSHRPLRIPSGAWGGEQAL